MNVLRWTGRLIEWDIGRVLGYCLRYCGYYIFLHWGFYGLALRTYEPGELKMRVVLIG